MMVVLVFAQLILSSVSPGLEFRGGRPKILRRKVIRKRSSIPRQAHSSGPIMSFNSNQEGRFGRSQQEIRTSHKITVQGKASWFP